MSEIDTKIMQSTTAAQNAASTSNAETKEAIKEEENHFIEQQAKIEEEKKAQDDAKNKEEAEQALKDAQKDKEEAEKKATSVIKNIVSIITNKIFSKKEDETDVIEEDVDSQTQEEQINGDPDKKTETEANDSTKNEIHQKYIEKEITKRVSDMDDATRKAFESFLENESGQLDISNLDGKQLSDLLSSFQFLKMNSLGVDWLCDAEYTAGDDGAINLMIDKIAQSYNEGNITANEASKALASIRYTMEKSQNAPTSEEIKKIASEKLGEDFNFKRFDSLTKLYETKEPKEAEVYNFKSMDDVYKLFRSESSIDVYKKLIFNNLTDENIDILIKILNNPSSLDESIDTIDNKQASLLLRAYETIKENSGIDFGSISEETQIKLAQKVAKAIENGDINNHDAMSALIGIINSGTKSSKEIYEIVSKNTNKISKDKFETLYNSVKAETNYKKQTYKKTYKNKTTYSRTSSISAIVKEVIKATKAILDSVKNIASNISKSNNFTKDSSSSANTVKPSTNTTVAKTTISTPKVNTNAIATSAKNYSEKKYNTASFTKALANIPQSFTTSLSSLMTNVGGATFKNLSANKEELEKNIQGTQEELSSIQNGDNEFIESAELNLEESVDEYNKVLNFENSELYGEMKDAISMCDESITQETENINQYRNSIGSINKDMSNLGKCIGQLDKAIGEYKSGIKELNNRLENASPSEKREIKAQIRKLTSLQEQTEKQYQDANSNYNFLSRQKESLNNKIIESYANIRSYKDKKEEIENTIDSITTDSLQSAKEKVAQGKTYLDEVKRQLTKQLESQLTNYKTELSGINGKIEDFGYNLTGIARYDNKDDVKITPDTQIGNDNNNEKFHNQISENNLSTDMNPATNSKTNMISDKTLLKSDYFAAPNMLNSSIDAGIVQDSILSVNNKISDGLDNLSGIQADIVNSQTELAQLAKHEGKLQETDVSNLSENEAIDLKHIITTLNGRINDIAYEIQDLIAQEEAQSELIEDEQYNKEDLETQYENLYTQNLELYDILARKADDNSEDEV